MKGEIRQCPACRSRFQRLNVAFYLVPATGREVCVFCYHDETWAATFAGSRERTLSAQVHLDERGSAVWEH